MLLSLVAIAFNVGNSIKQSKVVFKNVFFKFYTDGSEYILKHSNFTVLAGETVANIDAIGLQKAHW